MTDNIYTYPKKEDLEIIVGDEKQQDFKPRLKIKRWDNEVNFSVGVISAHAGTDSNISDKVEWDDGHGIKARFYEKPNDEFEFEIELASKPASNALQLSIESKGLDFFYQPELTEEEKETDPETGRPKCIRPDNVVGSYAVYHSTMQGDYVGGNNYRAGKFCHIYRPYVVDAKGWQVWCDLYIDNDMQITIPQDFINTAVYPIIVDPTFGCDPAAHGNSQFDNYNAHAVGSLHTSPANMDTAQSFTAYVRKPYTFFDNYNMKGLFVLHSNLNFITNGIGNASPLITSATGQWATSEFGTDPSPATSTEHVLATKANKGDYIFYDAGDENQGHDDITISYDSPDNFLNANHNNRNYSIYCTYTAAAAGGGGGILFNALSGPFVGPFGGPIQ